MVSYGAQSLNGSKIQNVNVEPVYSLVLRFRKCSYTDTTCGIHCYTDLMISIFTDLFRSRLLAKAIFSGYTEVTRKLHGGYTTNQVRGSMLGRLYKSRASTHTQTDRLDTHTHNKQTAHPGQTARTKTRLSWYFCRGPTPPAVGRSLSHSLELRTIHTTD